MKLGIGPRITALAVLVVSLTALVVGAAVYSGVSRLLVAEEVENLGHSTQLAAVRLLERFDTLRRDARLLAASPPVQGMVRASAAGGVDAVFGISGVHWRRQLRDLFESLLQVSPDYLQVRFFDTASDPFRVMRVARDGPIRAEPAGIPGYVQIALNLAPGEVYLSPVEVTSKALGANVPLVRAAVAITMGAGSPTCVVVIDMDFSGILQALQSLRSKLPDLKLYLTDREGVFLFHPESGRTFGPRDRIQSTFPDLARLFIAGNTEAAAVVSDVDRKSGQLLHFSKVFIDPADPRRFLGVALSASYRDVLAQSIRVGHRSALLTLFLGIGAGILAFVFSRVLTKPIHQLTVAAQQVAQGDYDVRLPVGAPDEVGVLARSFRRMIDQVQERGQALEHEAKELERVNQELQQFVYVVSHDLKAPLRAVSNLSTWIEEDAGAKLGDEEREHLTLLRARVQRMDEFIEALLAYSRAGRRTREPEPVDSGALAREIVTTLVVPEGFTVEVAPDMPVFVTDRLHLGQVFTNLIANAVRHHDRADGRVRIGCRALPGRSYEFYVADDGPGIPLEYQENIFQVFQTLIARDEGGSTGIGLSIVKKVVESYNGRVWVESAPGMGATFRFTWPKAIEG